jgi:hypothetical protein
VPLFVIPFIVILVSGQLQTPLAPQTNLCRPQETQNSPCASLIPEKLRHGGVPGRSHSVCCFANDAPHDGLLVLPPAAMLEEAFPRL